MKTIIVGFGSIGKRHYQVLTELGHECVIVSRHYKEKNQEIYSSLSEAQGVNPDYIVIANESSLHISTLRESLRYFPSCKYLIEKPLSNEKLNIDDIDNGKIFIGYNLRFHPILQKIKSIVDKEKVLTCNIYVGQYLPNWRPNRDYRDSYSASYAQGGGVLFDLSHEIDYASWLFGQPKKSTGIISKLSSLEIDSPDVAVLLSSYINCEVACIHMDYLDRLGTRTIIINTDTQTIRADLINNTLQVNDDLISFNCERNDTYLKMHQAIIQDDQNSFPCTLAEGIKLTNHLVNLSKKSVGQNDFI